MNANNVVDFTTFATRRASAHGSDDGVGGAVHLVRVDGAVMFLALLHKTGQQKLYDEVAASVIASVRSRKFYVELSTSIRLDGPLVDRLNAINELYDVQVSSDYDVSDC